jgi:hypothetical protein
VSSRRRRRLGIAHAPEVQRATHLQESGMSIDMRQSLTSRTHRLLDIQGFDGIDVRKLVQWADRTLVF